MTKQKDGKQDALDVNRRHRAQVRVRHVEWRVDLFARAAAHASCRLVTVVQEADLIDLVELASLGRNVARGEVEAAVEVLGA